MRSFLICSSRWNGSSLYDPDRMRRTAGRDSSTKPDSVMPRRPTPLALIAMRSSSFTDVLPPPAIVKSLLCP